MLQLWNLVLAGCAFELQQTPLNRGCLEPFNYVYNPRTRRRIVWKDNGHVPSDSHIQFVMPHTPGTCRQKKIVACNRRPEDPKNDLLLPRIESHQAEREDGMPKAEATTIKSCSESSVFRYSPPHKEAIAFVCLSSTLSLNIIRNLAEVM